MRKCIAVGMLGIAGILLVTFCNWRSNRLSAGLLPPRTNVGGRSDADLPIRELLNRQVEAWNRGDIEGFMAGYWKSEQTTFSGTSGVTRGWQGLLDRYRRNYPDRKSMGKLTFSRIEVMPLCADAAMILGDWHLEREEKPVGGVFTLVARRFPEGWRIIHDHTDAVAAQNP